MGSFIPTAIAGRRRFRFIVSHTRIQMREAALLSARELAAGGDVEVLTEEPGTLGDQDDGGEPSRDTAAGPPSDGLSEREHLRTKQGGL